MVVVNYGIGKTATDTAGNIEKFPGDRKLVKIRPGTLTVVAAVKGAGIEDLGSKVTSSESGLLQLNVD